MEVDWQAEREGREEKGEGSRMAVSGCNDGSIQNSGLVILFVCLFTGDQTLLFTFHLHYVNRCETVCLQVCHAAPLINMWTFVCLCHCCCVF